MATITRGRADLAAQAKQLIAGVDKLLANQTQVLLVGGTFTPAQITQRLQAIAIQGDVIGITVTPVTAQGPVVKAATSPPATATSPAPTAASTAHTAT